MLLPGHALRRPWLAWLRREFPAANDEGRSGPWHRVRQTARPEEGPWDQSPVCEPALRAGAVLPKAGTENARRRSLIARASTVPRRDRESCFRTIARGVGARASQKRRFRKRSYVRT